MLRIGSHLSATKGYLAMGKEATKIGANTFQFFTRNPRGGKAKELDLADIAAFNTYAEEHDISRILAHAPYTLNCSAAKEDLRVFARDVMRDDLGRLQHIPSAMYNFHPGSHVGQGSEQGISLIAEILNDVITEDQNTTVLLETMSGKGTEVGRNFQELADIIARVDLSDHMGVCLDTCHIWDGGYDIVNNLDGVLEEFDRIIGLPKLKAIHINDSKNPLDSHKDRHEKIGDGNIGLEGFVRIINHPALRDLPFFLETPNDNDGYAREIALLRSHYVEG